MIIIDKTLKRAYIEVFKNVNNLRYPSIDGIKKIIKLFSDNTNLALEVLSYFNQIFPSEVVFTYFDENFFLDILEKYNCREEILAKLKLTEKEIEEDLELIKTEEKYNIEIEDVPIKITNDCLLFHGTPSVNFKKIKNDGFIKATKTISDNAKDNKLLLNVRQKNISNIFFSDDFMMSIAYALGNKTDGYIFGVDLSEYQLFLRNYMSNTFYSKEAIPITKIKKVWHISNLDNTIKVEEEKNDILYL